MNKLKYEYSIFMYNLDNGALYTWGYGSNGRLGHGEEVDLLTPQIVEALKEEKIVHASCGGHHTAVTTGKNW